MANGKDFVTEIDWCAGCGYTACDSANDFNTIAEHVGSAHRCSCMGIVCMRLGGLTGGVCVADCRAMELERAYEAMYGQCPKSPLATKILLEDTDGLRRPPLLSDLSMR